MNNIQKKIANMTEEEKDKRLQELYEIEDKQSEILEKQTGVGLYPLAKVKEGKVIIDQDDQKQRKIWDV